MVQNHRFILVVFLTSITMIGVASGIKMAQIQNANPGNGTDAASNRQTYKDIVYDESLFKPAEEFFEQEVPSSTSTGPRRFEPLKKVEKVAAADPVKAEAYLVGDITTGKIYIEKNSTKVYPFASMSKLVTALVAEDTYKATDELTITEANTQVPKDASTLTAGEILTVKELLYPMLLNSSNVAAEVIASSTDRGKFLELMSSYSWEIGMSQAYFADPTGLSSNNMGTARGFFAMAQYLYSKRPEILAITRTPQLSIATTSAHNAHVFTNIHPFVKDPRFLGGKTGHTDAALDTMLTIMNINNHPTAFIVLRSPYNREADTKTLINQVSSRIIY